MNIQDWCKINWNISLKLQWDYIFCFSAYFLEKYESYGICHAIIAIFFFMQYSDLTENVQRCIVTKNPMKLLFFLFFFLTKLDTWMISSNNITSIIFCMVYYSTKVFSFFFHTCTIIRYIYLFHQVLQIYKFGNTWHEALFTKRIIIIRETHWRYKFIEKYCLFQFHYCYVVIMLNAWVIVLAIFMMYCYFCNIISFLRTFNFCSTGRK